MKSGCAHGIDGIRSEHLKYAVDNIVKKCVMFSLCLKYGVVPDISTRGIIIPLLKKTTCDPSLAKNYRPIVVYPIFS